MRDKRLLFGNPPVCGVVQPLLGQTETGSLLKALGAPPEK